VAAVRRSQIAWDERFGLPTEQRTAVITKHLLKPPVGQRERAIVIGQLHPIVKGVDQLPQHRLGDGRSPQPTPCPSWPLQAPRPRPAAGSCRPIARCRSRDARRSVHGRRGRRGGSCPQGRVDRDKPVEAIDTQHTPHDLGGNHQPQLRAAGGGPLVGAHHRIRASVIAGNRGGHIRDQLGGAAVDDRQQVFADLPRDAAQVSRTSSRSATAQTRAPAQPGSTCLRRVTPGGIGASRWLPMTQDVGPAERAGPVPPRHCRNSWVRALPCPQGTRAGPDRGTVACSG
jgi:hypothetical protein